MSWIFRKIYKSGPIRTTISKKGIGMSCGIPCFRVGVSFTGRKYFSIRVPGMGLYFIKYLSSKQPKKMNASLNTSPKNENNEVPWWKQENF